MLRSCSTSVRYGFSKGSATYPVHAIDSKCVLGSARASCTCPAHTSDSGCVECHRSASCPLPGRISVLASDSGCVLTDGAVHPARLQLLAPCLPMKVCMLSVDVNMARLPVR
eukprot:3035322-Amphidinium_carterae.1